MFKVWSMDYDSTWIFDTEKEAEAQIKQFEADDTEEFGSSSEYCITEVDEFPDCCFTYRGQYYSLRDDVYTPFY